MNNKLQRKIYILLFLLISLIIVIWVINFNSNNNSVYNPIKTLEELWSSNYILWEIRIWWFRARSSVTRKVICDKTIKNGCFISKLNSYKIINNIFYATFEPDYTFQIYQNHTWWQSIWIRVFWEKDIYIYNIDKPDLRFIKLNIETWEKQLFSKDLRNIELNDKKIFESLSWE